MSPCEHLPAPGHDTEDAASAHPNPLCSADRNCTWRRLWGGAACPPGSSGVSREGRRLTGQLGLYERCPPAPNARAPVNARAAACPSALQGRREAARLPGVRVEASDFQLSSKWGAGPDPEDGTAPAWGQDWHGGADDSTPSGEPAGPGSPAQRSACLSHPHGPHPGGAEVVGAGAPQMGPHRLRCVLHPPHPLVLPRPLQVDRQTKAEDEPRVTVSGGWTQPEAPCEPPGDSCGLRLCSESLWKRRCSRNTLIPPETSKAQVRRGGLPPRPPPSSARKAGQPRVLLVPRRGQRRGRETAESSRVPGAILPVALELV